MQKSEIKLTIVLIVFLLFSPISIHAISFDGENFFDNSENEIIVVKISEMPPVNLSK